jgi:hypothetical protein
VFVQDGNPNNPNHLTGVTAIAAGWDHTCALMNTGGVKCWGNNHHGEIGDGTQKDRLEPVNVSGLASGVDAISAGFDHTCALLSTGSVKCWGGNGRGQLGDGTKKTRTKPVSVHNLSSVASVSAGYNHTCAVTTSGAAKCWGANGSGELGDGTTKGRLQPVGVYRAGANVAQISAGGWKGSGLTCLVTTGGAAKCFGSNHGVSGLEPVSSHGGQIGDGTRTDRHIPITVRGLNGGSPAKYQPDLLISKFPRGGYAGNGTYNKTGANQNRTLGVRPGKTVKFFVKVQNDGKATDSFFLQGTKPGKGFSVTYTSGGKNIKAPVTSGTYWVTVKAGSSKLVVVSVHASSHLNAGAHRTFNVAARSAGNSGKVDVVRATVKV